MAFLEDPRLRQRWNQISQTTEAVTENAAAGIWTFGHSYINPCLGSMAVAIESCTAPCFGDHGERARRRRDRERTAEYTFDFYDDWDDDLGGDDSGGIMGGWRNTDWDRLMAGTGKSSRKGSAAEVQEQPRGRKRVMNYGTRGIRRKSSGAEDPTIIPSTQPIGFLGKLPFKIGGTLRYKPSAANLQEHPGASRHVHEGERQPLLGQGLPGNDDEYFPEESIPQPRKRSSTIESGDTSDSYRSRGDLFPSDGEGEEDAVPLDDEFAVALDRVDDGSSSRTKSSKGKKIAGHSIPRSGSRTTVDSAYSRPTSIRPTQSPMFESDEADMASALSMEDLHHEEVRIQQEEDEEVERKRQAAAQIALERGLQRDDIEVESVPEAKAEIVQVEEILTPEEVELDVAAESDIPAAPTSSPSPSPPDTIAEETRAPLAQESTSSESPVDEFVPARLPSFR
ncbi:hypothetical protein BJ170DRAFT_642609 [Xylariales sp. AK1849]|nr:hypothetical protein BJ170DRAFT_642609 [Xylariales sp. AK1849]